MAVTGRVKGSTRCALGNGCRSFLKADQSNDSRPTPHFPQVDSAIKDFTSKAEAYNDANTGADACVWLPKPRQGLGCK